MRTRAVVLAFAIALVAAALALIASSSGTPLSHQVTDQPEAQANDASRTSETQAPTAVDYNGTNVPSRTTPSSALGLAVDQPASNDGESSVGPDAARILARTEKVKAGLARFKSRTSGMSRESIERERNKLEDARNEMVTRQTAAPKIDQHQDEFGHRWERLTYESGAVRYELPESP